MLASCSSLLPKSFDLPTIAERAPDPRICAEPDDEPLIPEGAGLIAPDTEDPDPIEVAAQSRFIRWGVQHQAWGRRGWELVAIARERCPEEDDAD